MQNLRKAFQDISPTIRFLSLSDAILVSGLGLFGPIFAIYLADKIDTVNVLEVIGIGTAIFLFTRSLGQIPLAYFIDKVKGERDDFIILLIANLIFVIVPLLYILISEPWHLFAIQFLYGLGSAMTYPTWSAIFTRHVDKGKEGLEWSVYQSLSDLAAAVSAPVGAVIVTLYGFSAVMYVAAALGLLSSIVIFLIRNDLRMK